MYITIQNGILLELGKEVTLAAAAVLRTPLRDFSASDLLNRLLYLALCVSDLFGALQLSFAHDEANFGENDRQLQLVMFQEDEHVFNLISEIYLRTRHVARCSCILSW